MTRRSAFTLIELLVVISIIALLVGILLPALGAARRAAQSSSSLANVRSWGQASYAYTVDHKDVLAWDGREHPADPGLYTPLNGPTWQQDYWWANALPPYVGQEPYQEIAQERAAMGEDVPLPGEKSIFICPSATPHPNAPYSMSPTLKFYFCYVPNSKLNNNAPVSLPEKRLKISQIVWTSATALMVEMRSSDDEVPPGAEYKFCRGGNPNSNAPPVPVNQGKAGPDRFAGRHDLGGHILYADGHGGHVTLLYAVTPADPGEQVLDYVYNKPDLIWNPLPDP